MKTLVLALLVLSGCGPRYVTSYGCQVGPTPFYFEFEPNCEAVEYNVKLAKQLYSENNLMLDQEFDDLVAPMPVYVYDTKALWTFVDEDGKNRRVAGLTSINNVELTNSGEALFHEWLHVLNSRKLQPGTSWHEGWDTNGYDETNKLYLLRYKNLWLASPASWKTPPKTANAIQAPFY